MMTRGTEIRIRPETRIAESLHHLLAGDQNSSEGVVAFLNGPWGSGKTYFWKSVVRPKLNESKSLYVSLFGVKTAAELREKLIGAMLAGESEAGFLAKARQVVSNFGLSSLSVSGLQINCDVLELNSHRYVVCFDDLERLSKFASAEEILGFINYLSEHKAYRCLVILNQDELKTEHQSEFSWLREKISFRTFQFPIDITDRIEAFLDAKADFVGIDMSADEELRLKQVIRSVFTKNLRAVRFALVCYLSLRKSLNRELPEGLAKFLVALVDCETKGKIYAWEFFCFTPIDIYFHESFGRKAAKNLDTEPAKLTLQTSFYRDYFGENPYRPYRCVFDQVRYGHFDPREAELEVFPVDGFLSDHVRLAKDIHNANFMYWDDSRLHALIESVNTHISSENALPFKLICSYAMGLSAAYKLLEIEGSAIISSEIRRQANAAVRDVEDPLQVARELNSWQKSFLPIFASFLKSACEDEAEVRHTKILERSLASGDISELKKATLGSPKTLSKLFSTGKLASIWESEKLRREDIQHLLALFLNEMSQRSLEDPDFTRELTAIHDFLQAKYHQSTEKTMRRNLHRLLELCHPQYPAEPPIHKQNLTRQ